MTEKEDYGKLARKQLQFMAFQAQDYPAGHSMFLLAKLIYENPLKHVVIALKNRSDLEKVKGRLPLLANIIVVSECKDYPMIHDSMTFYVCQNHACLAPTNSLDAL